MREYNATLCSASANNPLFPSAIPHSPPKTTVLPGKPVIFVSACSSKKSRKTGIDPKWGLYGKRRCCVFGDEAPSPHGYAYSYLCVYVRACVCVCVSYSTACGRPRLASGLYRDYICKTIRLNHFLNKRVWSPSPLESSSLGQIGEQSPCVCAGK